jgi:hypothetical protein
MDRDKDARLTYEEFVEGSKQDPTIVQVSLPPPLIILAVLMGLVAVKALSLYDGLV